MAGSVLAVSPAGIVGKRLAEGPGSGVEPAEFEPQASLLLAVCCVSFILRQVLSSLWAPAAPDLILPGSHSQGKKDFPFFLMLCHWAGVALA